MLESYWKRMSCSVLQYPKASFQFLSSRKEGVGWVMLEGRGYLSGLGLDLKQLRPELPIGFAVCRIYKLRA